MNSKKRHFKRFVSQFSFEEIDHRLSCGWHAEIDSIGQRKKFLNKIKHTPKKEVQECL